MDLNLSCAVTGSAETPRMAVPALANSARKRENCDRLLGATGCVGLGIEVKDEVAALEIPQRDFAATVPLRVKAGAFAPAISSRPMCLPFVVFERSCRTCHLRRRGATGSTDMCRRPRQRSVWPPGCFTRAASDKGCDLTHARRRDTSTDIEPTMLSPWVACRIVTA